MEQRSIAECRQFIRAFYKGILDREPDPRGLDGYSRRLANGVPIQTILSEFVSGSEFTKKFSQRSGAQDSPKSGRFPMDYTPAASEAGKSYQVRRLSGFFDNYMSGDKILDVGYKGYDNPELRTVVPGATGVDLDFPGYDGNRLPFDDETIDCVFSSHCLEHILSYKGAIQDWYRVTKIGGFIVCIVPSQLLYEKRRNLPSRFNADHKRFYTPKSLLGEFEEALQENSYRIRLLEENDREYDYNIGPEQHAKGCYEIVLVVEKIKKPIWNLGP